MPPVDSEPTPSWKKPGPWQAVKCWLGLHPEPWVITSVGTAEDFLEAVLASEPLRPEHPTHVRLCLRCGQKWLA